jgi:hypothetical protein
MNGTDSHPVSEEESLWSGRRHLGLSVAAATIVLLTGPVGSAALPETAASASLVAARSSQP